MVFIELNKAKKMQRPQTWQELLGWVIEDSAERQRIADALGVAPITLGRWVKKESKPRPQNLRNLIIAVPEYRDDFLTLIEAEIQGFTATVAIPNEQPDYFIVPSEFYGRLMHNYTLITENLLFSSITDQILEQALKQLDPNRLGMNIVVVTCTTPLAGKRVRSLRERVGRGTLPWEEQLTRFQFLGAESLAGWAVASTHLEINQRLKQASLAPGFAGNYEESAIAIPIMRAGKIAGSLLFSSAQPEYFSPLRCTLAERYTELLALAFDFTEFYPTEQLELVVMPPFEKQEPLLQQFRKRVNQKITQSYREQRPTSATQAEQQVWQELETELLGY